ncbi:hypothetical protein LFWB_6120 [Candidatus Phytoplasma luffae]|uniref:Uncharacterized protein n=1 Tax=Loofah witches'-broom phytoplasma TaxID=35773 RepID=A0A975FJI7_LOWBP|nr:hypothetical protein LFWB_6120 [Candidatus Phytoplasma luffae]
MYNNYQNKNNFYNFTPSKTIEYEADNCVKAGFV